MDNTTETTKNNKRSNIFWLAFLAGIGAFCLLLGVLFFTTIIAAVSGGGSDSSFTWKFTDDDDDDRAQVGVVELAEEIRSSRKIVDHLYKFRDDEDIVAVVLRIESPGGSAAHSQEMYRAVKAVREKKPVVVSMGQVAASGGYYVAAAADKIYALPGTITASIGVISVTTEIKDLLAWMKMKPHVYKTGQYKDMLSPLREPTPEDEAMINQMLMDIYEQFVADVLSGRPNLKEDELRAIADGRVLTGAQAKASGLVDELGSLREAARAAAVLAKAPLVKDPKLVYPKKDREEWIEELLADSLTSATTRVISQTVDRYGIKLLWPGALDAASAAGAPAAAVCR